MFKITKDRFDLNVRPQSGEDNAPNWLTGIPIEDEGHLAVDVFQRGDKIIVKSTIAGAKPEDLSVSVSGDILTVSGERRLNDQIDYQDYLYRECYWGKFSRTIILPSSIDEDKVEAGLEDGVLTVILPKSRGSREAKIIVK